MRKLTALIMLGLILAASVSGQVPNLPNIQTKEGDEQSAADKPASGVHELTDSDVGAFLDGIVPLQLAREDIAGATVSIVKDGNILFARGYGYADVEQKKPVSAAEDGTIEVAALTAPNGKPRRWREIAPMIFREVDGQDTLIFKPDQNGQMQMAISFPFMIFQRVGLWENNRVLLPVLGISLLIMLLTLILWFVAWLVRRHYGHKLKLTPMERWLRIGVRIVFALNLFFIAALTGLIVYATTNIDFLSDRGNTWFHLVQVIGVLGAIGTLLVLYNAIRTWTNKRSGIWGKLQATIFVLACLGFLWFALAGNLLHFSSTY